MARGRASVDHRAPGLGGLFLTTDLSYFKEVSGPRVTLRFYDQASDIAYKVWREGPRCGAERSLVGRPLAIARAGDSLYHGPGALGLYVRGR